MEMSSIVGLRAATDSQVGVRATFVSIHAARAGGDFLAWNLSRYHTIGVSIHAARASVPAATFDLHSRADRAMNGSPALI
jgi:hypothetical protein